MSESKQSPEIAAPQGLADVDLLRWRVSALEQALAEYVERYGLTDKAREAFRDPKR